jgi:hypothetical protein
MLASADLEGEVRELLAEAKNWYRKKGGALPLQVSCLFPVSWSLRLFAAPAWAGGNRFVQLLAEATGPGYRRHVRALALQERRVLGVAFAGVSSAGPVAFKGPGFGQQQKVWESHNRGGNCYT